jgi:SpoVK/Ycf46/Vps4 family AAA+-type ATPase
LLLAHACKVPISLYYFIHSGCLRACIKYYKYVGYNSSSHQAIYDEYNFIPTKRFDNIFFKGKDKFVNNINYFSNNKDAYRELGIPYSLGILLYGPAGTGKTSCMKAVASMLKRHLIDISLSKIKSQKELREIFYGSKINGNDCDFSKRIYVLDELDAILDIIKDRKLKDKDYLYQEDENQQNNLSNNLQNNLNTVNNKTNYNNKQNQIQTSYNINNNKQNQNFLNLNDKEEFDGVRLEDLLTIMDGCVEQDGPIFIATTNYIDLIDKALKRPGRFDICLHLDNSDHEIIEQIIEHFGKKHKNILKKKHKHNNSSSSSLRVSDKINKNNKLSNEHKNLIKKYYKHMERNIWSPASISQICLFNIDNPNYYDCVVQHIVNNYEEQCKNIN